MPAMQRKRGASLAVVLMISALVCVAAFTLAALAVQQVNLSQAFESDRVAQSLAEGLVAEAMADLHANPTFGRARTEVLRTAADPEDPTRYATLTFDPNSGGPFCTNNWDGNSPVGYGNAEIPPGNTHLWVVGHAGSVSRGIEVMVSVPQAPFALQGDGPLTFTRSLTVDGAPDLDSALDIVRGVSPSQMAASIASNASIHGTDPCDVSGNVDSPGTTDLPLGSTVGGTIRTDHVDVPQMDPANYDPSGQSDATQITASSLTSPAPITQRCYTTGSLTVHGDLELDNGLLYVPGDLVVDGSVYGHGMVSSTGNVTIRQGTSLSGTVQETALLAGGDVSLSGNFVGLLYTQGRLSASGGTLIGSFIAGGSRSSIAVDGVTAIYVPDAAQFLLRNIPATQAMPQFVQQNSVLSGLAGLSIQVSPLTGSAAQAIVTTLQQPLSGKTFSLGTLPVSGATQVNATDPRLYHALPPPQTSMLDLTTATSIIRPPGQPLERVLVKTAPAFTWNGTAWVPASGSGWTTDAAGQGAYPNPTVLVNGAVPPSVTQVDLDLRHYNHTSIARMVAAIYSAQLKLTQLLSASTQAQAPAATPWAYDLQLSQFTRNPVPLSVTSWRDH